MQSTVKSQKFGMLEIGRYAYFVEEFEASPTRFCGYLNRESWSDDRVKDLSLFLREVKIFHVSLKEHTLSGL